MLWEELSFQALCDMISPDVYAMAEAITDKYGNILPSICPPECNLAYISKVFVEETCPGSGVGRYLLDNMNPLLLHALNINPLTCALLPYPQVKTRYGALEDAPETADKDLPRLMRFYESVEFNKIGTSKYL